MIIFVVCLRERSTNRYYLTISWAFTTYRSVKAHQIDPPRDLIISKGINIYPREIEEVLFKLPEVEAAAVIGVRDEHADEEVTAFIQFKEDMSLDEKDIRAHLKKHLANFKIPKTIYFKDELPKNATGKVLKRVLKEQIKDEI